MEELSDRLPLQVGEERGGVGVEVSNFYQTQVILLAAEETRGLNIHIPLLHPRLTELKSPKCPGICICSHAQVTLMHGQV